jgi:TolB protein
MKTLSDQRQHKATSALCAIVALLAFACEPARAASGHVRSGLIAFSRRVGPIPPLAALPGVGSAPVLTPALVRLGVSGLEIFTAQRDGSGARQLTFEGDNGRPDWSPDGTKIAFSSIRNLNNYVGVMHADGSHQTMLAQGGNPDWSPDGHKIAFGRGGQIWVMNADGAGQTQITRSPTPKDGPSWSPDGKQMAFIALVRYPAGKARPEIGIMDSDGTGERILTTGHRVNVQDDGTTAPANDANAPAWSPVGDRIAFWSGIEGQYGQVWVINADGTASTQLTEDPSRRNTDDPSWSRDGRSILFNTGRSGKNELWAMDADGRDQRRLFGIDAFPFPGRASWQPARD